MFCECSWFALICMLVPSKMHGIYNTGPLTVTCFLLFTADYITYTLNDIDKDKIHTGINGACFAGREERVVG